MGEVIHIGDNIRIEFVRYKHATGTRTDILIHAPKDVKIVRTKAATAPAQTKGARE
jgi:sRNA-binding carbon storage regulator CsrA